jgi:hypothetical protein
MKPTDVHDSKLFLAPAGSAAAESEAEACDSSAEAMTRLRDPFAVDGGRPSTTEPRDAARRH